MPAKAVEYVTYGAHGRVRHIREEPDSLYWGGGIMERTLCRMFYAQAGSELKVAVGRRERWPVCRACARTLKRREMAARTRGGTTEVAASVATA